MGRAQEPGSIHGKTLRPFLSVKPPQTMMMRATRRDLGEMGAAMTASSSDRAGEVNVR